jgi:hypothetical protein
MSTIGIVDRSRVSGFITRELLLQIGIRQRNLFIAIRSHRRFGSCFADCHQS